MEHPGVLAAQVGVLLIELGQRSHFADGADHAWLHEGVEGHAQRGEIVAGHVHLDGRGHVVECPEGFWGNFTAKY